MSAEGKPPTEFSPLGQPLKLLTVLVARFPVSVIIISALLLALSLTGAWLNLGFRTSRSDLLNPNSAYNKCWNEFTAEFGDQDDVTVVVYNNQRREAVPPILDEVAAELQRQENSKYFGVVQHKIDVAKLKSKALYNDRFSVQMLQGIDALLSPPQGKPPDMAIAQSVAAELSKCMSKPDDRLASEYTLSKDGHIGLVALHLEKNDKQDSFTEYSDGLAVLRRIVHDLNDRETRAKTGTWIGLTGIPIMENDEMESSQTAMTKAGVFSFLGVALLYIAGFGCVRHPAMALACLLVPMGWAFGYILVTIGHLNILSSAFATIVIGLGSDYGVYHIAQYLRLRAAKMSTFEALLETARSVGPGLTTSAVATALAFFAIGCSKFPGIAELGIIAGGGILLCWVAALTTLPAMIHCSDARREPWPVPAPLDVYAYLRPLVNRPKLVVAGYAVFTLLICAGLIFPGLRYDNNLLNLQAEGMQSVELEKVLLQKDFGASFAVVVAKSREEVVARNAMYTDRKRCPMVDKVDEIATWVPTPADVAQKRPLIKRIHDRLATAQLPPALQWLYALRGISNDEPPTHDDFPEGVKARLIGKSGYFCMQIHTQADIWDGKQMEQFVGQLRDVDEAARKINPAFNAAVTGNPVQVYESSRELIQGYETGALYGVIIVVAVVWLDFRSIRMTLLALVPLVTSKLQLFGLMAWLGISLNPANMIVLPLILGIGVDTGVQIVHDYLREPRPYRMPASTSAALVINTLMNIVGFGALMIADHRGLHSLGRVLTLGMACCLLSCLVMPSLLQLLPDKRANQPVEEQPPLKVHDGGIELAGGSDVLRGSTPAIRRRAA